MHETLGLSQVARELGASRKIARKWLAKYRWAYPPRGIPPRWDARIVDFIHAVRGQPHRPLEPAHQDWLTRYQKGL